MAGGFGHISWRQASATLGAERLRSAPRAAASTATDALIARFVYLAVALYAVTFAVLSVLQHQGFQTHAFDLGNMDQAVWNTAQGRPLEFTNWSGGTNRLAAHVEPILFLVALAYRVYSSPVTLLVIQSVVISLGAIPAFWLAREVLRSSFAAVVFALSYLLAPTLEIANLADFHAVAFSSALLLYAFYYAYRRRYAGFFIAAVLGMATKEHVPLSVFVMGLYIAFVQRQTAVGGVTCALAALWAWTAFGVVIPHFNPEGASPYLSRYDQLGKGPLEIVTGLFLNPRGTYELLTEPAKVQYIRDLLSPTLYLALLSPATLLMALPDLAINLLSNFTETYSGWTHYGAVIVPFVTVSAILSASLLRRLAERIHPALAPWCINLVALLVLVTSLSQFRTQVFLPISDHVPRITPHNRMAQSIMDLIPPDAAVSTSSTLNPHVSQRQRLYLFPDIDYADYIFLDVTATPYPIDQASQWWRVQQLLDGDEWGIVAARDGYLLLRRGAEGRTLPEEFYSFVQKPPSAVGKPLDVSFGQAVRLVGYQVEPSGALHGNNAYALLTLFWQVEQTPRQDFLISVTVVGEDGATVSIDRNQATTLWYPPTRWRTGGPLQVVIPYLPLGAADGAEVRVSLVERGSPFKPISGLFPRVTGTGGPEVLRDDGASVLVTKLRRG